MITDRRSIQIPPGNLSILSDYAYVNRKNNIPRLQFSSSPTSPPSASQRPNTSRASLLQSSQKNGNVDGIGQIESHKQNQQKSIFSQNQHQNRPNVIQRSTSNTTAAQLYRPVPLKYHQISASVFPPQIHLPISVPTHSSTSNENVILLQRQQEEHLNSLIHADYWHRLALAIQRNEHLSSQTQQNVWLPALGISGGNTVANILSPTAAAAVLAPRSHALEGGRAAAELAGSGMRPALATTASTAVTKGCTTVETGALVSSKNTSASNFLKSPMHPTIASEATLHSTLCAISAVAALFPSQPNLQRQDSLASNSNW